MSDIKMFDKKLGEFTWSGTDKKSTSINEKLVNYELPLEEADKYYFLINNDLNIKYICNYVLDGTSWVTFSYKVNDLDSISIRVNKNSNITEITLRPDNIEGGINLTSDSLSLFKINETPSEEDNKMYALIRFTNSKAVKVIYNVNDDDILIEEV